MSDKVIEIKSVDLMPGESFMLATIHVSKHNKVNLRQTEFTHRKYKFTCGKYGGITRERLY